ncbi:beta-ketoacyl-[acyl-carrier-protein] synthase family protein [Actinophytocola xinjiangensis]|uniref:beta-ketoacyl-[acyl-carrier-protein] synthase family protein n=1 Tax=Actinophytocola xinjiangensis TaxID=485602 RepID=UPI000A55CF4F|nr:beta-ketoacyl-[acyl-carrier-protein] synthase family protein [Actinophytocola xinjiangensis]
MYRVAITGLGLVTPAGIGLDANRDRVWSGESCATPDESLRGCPVEFSCRVPGFDADVLIGGFAARGLDRFTQLAVVAARQAVADAGLDPAHWDGPRVGVVLGNSLGGVASIEASHSALLDGGPRKVSPLLVPRYMANMVAAQVALDLGAKGPSQVTATACASGATAIGVARDLLRHDVCDVVIAGGAEAALTPLAISGLARMGALSRAGDPAGASRPFDVDRDGFVPGEGAGVLVLERPADALARGARAHAMVDGYGAATDAHHPTAPAPGGEGLEQALRAALADAGLDGAAVDHVNAHGTSTPIGDVIEGRVLRRVLGDRALVTSTKGVTGHPLAAAGAVEAAYTALAIEHGSVPPTANLTRLEPGIDLDVVHGTARPAALRVAVSTSMGFGGHNAALVLTAA